MGYTKKRTTFKRKSPLKKRGFYAKADLGIFGKYELGKRSLMKRNLTSTIKAVVDGDKEVKRKIISTQITALQATHFTRNILGNVPQGTSTLQRESEEIHLCSFKGTLSLFQQFTAGNYNNVIRIMLVRSKLEYLAGTDSYGSGLGTNDLYLQNVMAANFINSQVDPKKVQILWEKKIITGNKNGLTAATINNVIQYVDFNVPLNIDYVYKTGSNFGNKYNLYWVIIPNAFGTTTGVTPVYSIEEDSQLIYKDK